MWYQRSPGRLIKEQTIMRASFPQARLVKVAGNRLAWVVTLKSNTGRIYTVEIVYPDGFPADYPKAFVVDPSILNAPHQYNNGQLCLFNANDRPERSYIPEKTTAATVTAWVAGWLASLEIWQKTGTWPERRVR